MNKIPTLFLRDEKSRGRVTREVDPRCQWVLDGEGVPFQKLDGTCCAVLVNSGPLWKRRTVRPGKAAPSDFVHCETDEATGKAVGWVPVTAADKWHNEAFHDLGGDIPEWTYELVGPKVQGNPESEVRHRLVSHHDRALILNDPPGRSFDELELWLVGKDLEGVVWHHENGRMAKIKLSDFGLKRPT